MKNKPTMLKIIKTKFFEIFETTGEKNPCKNIFYLFEESLKKSQTDQRKYEDTVPMAFVLLAELFL